MSKIKDECIKCEKLDFYNLDCLDRKCDNFPCDDPHKSKHQRAVANGMMAYWRRRKAND